MTSETPTPFSKFRTEVENEIIRQQSQNVPSAHFPYARALLNPKARTSYVTLLNTGFLPVPTLANILEIIFHKEMIEVMPDLWDLHIRGERSSMHVYLTTLAIARNKVRQSNAWLTQTAWKLGIQAAKMPVFFIEEYTG